MKAGKELDALIGEKIMASVSKKVPGTNFKEGPSYEVSFVKKVCHETGVINVGTRLEYPPYSTNIAVAWKVVEQMYDLGWDMSFELFKNEEDKPECRVEFARIEQQEKGAMQFADTISHAVCLAALKAIEANA